MIMKHLQESQKQHLRSIRDVARPKQRLARSSDLVERTTGSFWFHSEARSTHSEARSVERAGRTALQRASDIIARLA